MAEQSVGRIMGYIGSFKRVEMKYLLSAEKYKALSEAVRPNLEEDQYGRTTICNIYFDTENYDIISHSIEKCDYKEKLRLRSYGVPENDSTVFLEIKKKYDDVVYKRRIGLEYSEAVNFLENGIPPQDNGQIFREIDYFMKHYKPEPKLFIAYDRTAFCGKKEKELRVTFDFNIRSRRDELSLISGDSGKMLFNDDSVIMEIKANGAVPMWLAETLSELKIYKTSFSKYGQIYKNDIIKREHISCLEASSIPLSV
ncbi:MAG: polyphosphate polymerase domain-containing protein [Oscillospiraceae bacterium]